MSIFIDNFIDNFIELLNYLLNYKYRLTAVYYVK